MHKRMTISDTFDSFEDADEFITHLVEENEDWFVQSYSIYGGGGDYSAEVVLVSEDPGASRPGEILAVGDFK